MTKVRGRIAFALRTCATFTLFTLCAMLMLAAAVMTAFQKPRLYREHIAAPFGRMTLALWRVALVMPERSAFPHYQCIYVSNHSSTIDMFVLIALGLPNTRFFLSGFLRGLLPLGLIGYLTGIFWTVDQKYPERRARIFQCAEAALRRSGESVYLSPEGERITTGEIGHFNKGAFHLATNLHIPIVPLYIAIPRSMDPGMGWEVRPGQVEVYLKAPIDTSTWTLGDLLTNKERVRNLYLLWHKEHKR